MAGLDRISVAGGIALAVTAVALYAWTGFSPVPPGPSSLGVISGYTLVTALVALWIVPLFGRRSPPGGPRGRFQAFHRLLGIAFVVLLAVHARSGGHDILLAMGVLAPVMALVAFFHAQVQAANKPALLVAWWVVHLGLATALSVMAILHVYAQYAYST